MQTNFRNRILAWKKVVGIELTFLANNSFTINCIILEVKNKKISITATHYNITSLATLKEKIPDDLPVTLIVNGKGLIQKRLALSNTRELPENILPGVNLDDFIFETYDEMQPPDIAIIRKDAVESIIADFFAFKMYVVKISLAFYDIKYILPFIDKSQLFNTTQYQIRLDNKNIVNYVLTDASEKEILVKPEIDVNSAYIKSNFIIAYSSALQLLTDGIDKNDDIELESILSNRNKLKQNILLKVYGFSFLGGLLILLLVNFFIYNFYFEKNNKLLSSYQYTLQEITKADTLFKELKGKKEFLSKAGWINDTKMISYYADRVAATIPDSVTLTNLNIYPALSKFSLGVKQWSFQQDTILLTGYCNDPTLLDTWIDQIKTIKNIKQSKINSYLNKKQGTAGIFTAEVLIK